jgi:tRNA pseudouridine55 synthase
MALDLSIPQAGTALDGVLVLAKPLGWTSHDVVAKVRTLTRTRKAGHTGTLDPSATGVLVLCLGKATRIAEYLLNSDKAYRAVLRLGVSTDTQDATGTVVHRHTGGLPDDAAIRAVMGGLVGVHRQVPPMYSAVKVKGVPLYKSARAGRTVARQAREVTVRSLQVLGIAPTASPPKEEGGTIVGVGGARVPVAPSNATGDGPPPTIDVLFDVVCSKGTYIRTLCADIGETLGVGGHLAGLERRKVGRFGIEEALSLEELAELAARDAVGTRLLSLTEVLADLPAITVDEAAAEGVCHGGAVPAGCVRGGDGPWAIGAPVRVHGPDGHLLGIGRIPPGAEDPTGAASGVVYKVEKVLV